MAYYQNPFNQDFLGFLLLSDKQFNLTFKVPANVNQTSNMVAWNPAPYNTTGNTTLTINYSIDSGVSYYQLPCTITSGTCVSVNTIVNDLNTNTNFANYFLATNQAGNLVIQQLSSQQGNMAPSLLLREKFKCYISNTGAETILRFNLRAGVAELPAYFDRHTIANIGVFPDCVGMLVGLVQPDDNALITAAGLSTTPQDDWQLMAGRSSLFTFQKMTLDSDRITEIIEYSAGAKIGDLARKIQYTYTDDNTSPDQITEIPYVLTGSGDMVTPP